MRLYPKINIIFLIWCVCILFTAYLGFLIFPHSLKFDGNFFESLAANWDGGHYISIAKYGYTENSQYAFFPLYPLIIRFVSQITKDYMSAAIFISVVSSILAINLLYRLVSHDFGRIIADKSIRMLLFFPTSFYLLTGYSEGLFLFLVISTFYFLRRNNLFLATIICAFASATRLVGLAVVLGLLIEIQTTKGFSRKNWYVLFAPLGFVMYCFYLYTQTGDPFYFITAEANWQRHLTVPGFGFWETIKNLAADRSMTENFNGFLDLLFAIFGLGFVFRAFRFLPTSYSVYGLISLLLPLFTPQLSSMPRFLLPIFPIFILVALVKNKHTLFAYQLVSIMLLGLFATLFINGYWIS